MIQIRDSIITDSSLEAADRIRDWLKTLLNETATNISRHAYRGDASGTITSLIDVRPDRVRLVLTHHGDPFDRDACWRPDGHRVVLIRKLAHPSPAGRLYNAGHEPET